MEIKQNKIDEYIHEAKMSLAFDSLKDNHSTRAVAYAILALVETIRRKTDEKK